jgi:iron complex outermembrane receptor protein
MILVPLRAAVRLTHPFRVGCAVASALVLASLTALPARAQSGAGASVIGQVSNVATGSYLQGAVVSATGQQRSAITDREGRFELRDLPAGPLTLAVSYTGLDPQEVTVTVAAGQRIVRDIGLTSKIYRMEKFSVAGEREGTALAETLQRQAPNVKNVVSSDTFGNVADGNVGDLLQHVVGITADYNGPDVRQVSIRGVSSALSSVTMDGQHMATAQSSGLGRSFEFEQASLGNIETIEVTKAATPDMEGSSIGGSINMVTKSAFDRAIPRRLDYTIGFATRPHTLRYNNSSWWKMPVAGYGPSLNFSFTDVIGADRRIGVTLNGMVHSLPWGGGQSGLAFERRATPGPVYTWQTRRVVVGPTRSRAATGVKLDYRWSDQTTVSFNTSYNYFHENGDTRTNTLEYTARLLATVDAVGNRTGGGFIHPNYADNITRILPGGTGTFSGISITTVDKSGRTYVFQPSVRHRFRGLQIDYSVSYSSAANWYDSSHDRPKFKAPAESRPKGVVSMRLNNIGWTVDRSRDPIWPTVRQTHGPDMYDLNNYRDLLLTQNDQRGYDSVISGKFDVKKDFVWRRPVTLKSGFLWREQSRKVWSESRRYNYAGVDGIFGTADDNVNMAQFVDTTHLHQDDEVRNFRDRGGIPVWPNPYLVAKHQDASPRNWKEDIAFGTQNKLQNNRKITESIAAAYVMGTVSFGRLSTMGGVRFEETRLKGEGGVNYISPEERARRAAWVGVVTDDEARRRAIAQYGGRARNRGQYDNIFPGIHFKYEPVPGLLSRLSWSTGVGRPAFGSIIPNESIDDNTQRITISNPNLVPQEANNYDFTVEYYFRPQGMISAGVFAKRIKNYIYTDSSQTVPSGANNGFQGQYEGYGITTSANGGRAKINGLELNYQQQLTFLPGWMKGFGVYANFTKLETTGDNTGPSTTAGGTLAGFLNKTGNLGVSYRGYGFDIRPQAVYRGRYLVSTSTDPSLVTYQRAKTTWSIKSRYALNRHLSVFLDLENLFSEPVSLTYALYSDRVILDYQFPTKIVGGLTGRF